MKNILVKGFFIGVWLSVSLGLSAQDVLDTIFVNNPSFEHPYKSRYVQGWTDCSFPGETEFDPQPGFFGCYEKPAAGQGFVGLVVRDNESYEAMSQRLTKPLVRGKCYAFSLKLARSKSYTSQSRTTGKEAYYITPARVRIWGGDGPCQTKELLAESGLVVSYMWKTFNFKFKPIRDYQYIIIQAFYKTPTLFPYNGNVLVDDATNIYEMKCDDNENEIIAVVRTPKLPPKVVAYTPPPPKKVEKPKVVPHTNVKPKKKEPSEKVNMPELNDKVAKGQVLRIRNLNFTANSSEIPDACHSVLNELYEFMKENPDVRIELGGHTNNRCDTPYCNSLSEKRAKAVADYLIAKGISPDRVTYKGYGKTRPIASNSSLEGRKKNQRVEVRVL